MATKSLTTAGQKAYLKAFYGNELGEIIIKAIDHGVITFKWASPKSADWREYHINLGKCCCKGDWNAVLGLQIYSWAEDKMSIDNPRNLMSLTNFVKAMSATYLELVETGKITDKERLTCEERS